MKKTFVLSMALIGLFASALQAQEINRVCDKIISQGGSVQLANANFHVKIDGQNVDVVQKSSHNQMQIGEGTLYVNCDKYSAASCDVKIAQGDSENPELVVFKQHFTDAGTLKVTQGFYRRSSDRLAIKYSVASDTVNDLLLQCREPNENDRVILQDR